LKFSEFRFAICERVHKTLDEFYRVAFRKELYGTIEALQTDLDAGLIEYNEQRSHQGRCCYGKTPMRVPRCAAACEGEVAAASGLIGQVPLVGQAHPPMSDCQVK
jgi:hypothetical protein